MKKHNSLHLGFTIIEILVVVVVIAILATVTVVAYRGITNQSKQSALMLDLSTVAKKLLAEKVDTGNFPTTKPSYAPGNLSYAGGGEVFCVSGQVGAVIYHVTQSNSPREGECPLDASMFLQTTTSANCPTARTMRVDARDMHTYWVQKMPDGKCWMLTNLAYGGGGDDLYHDVKGISAATSSADANLLDPLFYVNGYGAGSKYPNLPYIQGGVRYDGYMYNLCAAMGAQIGTAACSASSTPVPNKNISICPYGWRLPATIGGNATEYTTLIGDIGGTLADVTSKAMIERPQTPLATSSLSSDGVYLMFIHSSGGVYSSYNDYRKLGMHVRCVI